MLPEELWNNVIQHLSLKDILSLGCTCKQLTPLRPGMHGFYYCQ